MPRHVPIVATIAIVCSLPALGQEGSWGDGHAASFNIPIGHSAQPEFISKPKPPKWAGKRTRKPVLRRFGGVCADEGNLRGAGVGRRAHHGLVPDEQHLFCEDIPGAPTPDGSGIGSGLTVVSIGSRNAPVEQSKQKSGNSEPPALNGGLDLD